MTIAIIGKDFVLTYKELFSLIKSHEPTSSIFFAPPTLESIITLFSLFDKGLPACPISPREPHLPTITLPSNPITCLATSGTTSTPKFVLHSLDAHFYSAENPLPDLALQENDHYLLSLPLNHIGGLAILFRCLLYRATIVLPDAPTRQITHLSFVPTQLKRFLEKKEIPYPDLKAILVGGASIPLSLCLEAYQRGIPLYLTYGMTEMASQVATKKFNPDDGVIFGPPLPGREIKITPEGEILVRGKTAFLGYLNMPSPFINSWYPTKDLGTLTEKGLSLLGRKDRMIISGGENIHLEEIEKAALSLPHVLEAKGASRNDPEFGERPILTLYTNKSLSKEEIRESLKKTLPSYKVPCLNDLFFRDQPLSTK